MLETKQALHVAGLAAPWIDIIEIGTPLLKHEGIEVVKRLASAFPDKTILVDTKTMDVGAYEAKFCFEAGAKIVTVLGVADDNTIIGAVTCANRYGGTVMVDLINEPDKAQRVRQLEQLGVHVAGVHSGIDQQQAGHSPLEDLRIVRRNTDLPVAVAGGINIANIDAILAERPETIIVGGAITSAENVAEAAQAIKEKM
ncbi:MAG: 3-hexulose-6-phosphate synthase [Gammaproteobacteria bacterium]|nr:3-hexulose-6-phosphate synthase [Gammaproteobacteria bacterium]